MKEDLKSSNWERRTRIRELENERGWLWGKRKKGKEGPKPKGKQLLTVSTWSQ